MSYRARITTPLTVSKEGISPYDWLGFFRSGTTSSKVSSFMVVRVVKFSSGGTKLERFFHKNQHHHRKLSNFRIGLMVRCWKLGIVLVIKGCKNWSYRKMSIAKIVLLQWNEKDSDNFWHRRLTMEVKFRHYFTPSHYSNSWNEIIFFGYVDW